MNAFRRTLLTLAAAACMAAQAAPTQLNVNNTTVDFDPEAWTASSTFAGPLDPNTQFSVSVAAGGIAIDFNGHISAFADSLTFFTPDSQGAGFNMGLGFSADAGFQILGYTITVSGTYDIESPGSMSAGLPIGPEFFDSSSAAVGTPFSLSAPHAGAVAPALVGGISAYADVQEVQTGTTLVEIGQREVCTDPTDPTTCYFEPIFEEQPVYMTDYGIVSVNLQRLLVVPNVAAIPEPQTYALMAFGLLGVACAARRRRATA
jgi:hypothetical protein